MIFEKPKVEFVPIDMAVAITTTSIKCSKTVAWYNDEGDPSIETCDGPDAPMNNCKTMSPDGFMD